MTTLDTTAAGAIVPRYKTCKNETYTYSTEFQRKNTPDHYLFEQVAKLKPYFFIFL